MVATKEGAQDFAYGFSLQDFVCGLGEGVQCFCCGQSMSALRQGATEFGAAEVRLVAVCTACGCEVERWPEPLAVTDPQEAEAASAEADVPKLPESPGADPAGPESPGDDRPRLPLFRAA